MDWRATVTENWPYKLAAIVLALLLWLNVTAEERQEFPVPTDVQVEVQDEGWVLVDVVPSQVRTIFQGYRGPVMPRMPVIRQVVDSVTGPRMELELSPRMVRGFDRELDLRPISVRPQTIELHLEERVTGSVPVQPQLKLSAAPGFAVLWPVLLQPDSVTLRGARSEVTSVSVFQTEDAVLEDLRTTLTRELRLVPPDGIQNVTWSPETVLATVQVDSLVERSLVRPVVARGLAADGVELDPDSVQIRLRGPQNELQSLSPSRIGVHVLVDSVPPEPTTMSVQLDLPGGLQVTADPEPAEVTVQPGDGAGS